MQPAVRNILQLVNLRYGGAATCLGSYYNAAQNPMGCWQQQAAQCMHMCSAAAADTAHNKLVEHLRSKIMMRGGPITLAEFMQDALTSPHGGYYMSRDVFGAAGDFVTSPEISQMFGEMIGIWAVHTWMQMGKPPRLNLVELGPGRGTLMADLLRGTAAFKPFLSALHVHMVEVSPALRSLQWRALSCQAAAETAPSGSTAAAESGDKAEIHAQTIASGVSSRVGCQVAWHNVLDTVPTDAPAIYIAHEFFDALPVHQFVKDPTRGWLEKMVDVADQADEGSAAGQPGTSAPQQQERQGHVAKGQQNFRLVLSPTRTPASALLVPRRLAALEAEHAARKSKLIMPDSQRPVETDRAEQLSSPAAKLSELEVSAKAMAAAEALALRVGKHGGAALIIDYGQDGPYADSLVALRQHQKKEVLQDPGCSDLSAWVDFSALRQAALESGAAVRCQGPVAQAHFLHSMGIQARLEQLLKKAKDGSGADALRSGFSRITGMDADGMGSSYKVMAITDSSLPELAGFEVKA